MFDNLNNFKPKAIHIFDVNYLSAKDHRKKSRQKEIEKRKDIFSKMIINPVFEND